MTRRIASLFALLLLAAAAALAPACHPIEEYDNTLRGNFDALWTIVDEHYCFFGDKEVDWSEVRSRYAPRMVSGMSTQQLFDVLSDMLGELRDGHVNLSSTFSTFYYRDWWSAYPQNFDRRLVLESYLHFSYRQLGPVVYGILPSGVGYIMVESFDSELGDYNLDAILTYFAMCRAIVIDVRDNGGGKMTAASVLASRFITERTLAGYMVHKTGPGHDDFSSPRAFYYSPPSADHRVWTKPVVVLTNRSTFSAANAFVEFMRSLPQVSLVGDTTGGGSGMPMSYELPIGWTLRMSAVSVLDPAGVSTEAGIAPDLHVDLDPDLALQGIDTMLDAAVRQALDFNSSISDSSIE